MNIRFNERESHDFQSDYTESMGRTTFSTVKDQKIPKINEKLNFSHLMGSKWSVELISRYVKRA